MKRAIAVFKLDCPKRDKRKRPARAKCPYCGNIVTGKHLGKTIYGWGCKDEERCGEKARATC